MAAGLKLPSGDSFNISADGGGNTIITQNGSTIDTIATDTLLSLSIAGDTAGTVTVDYSNGDPLPSSGLSTDSQTIDVTADDGGDDGGSTLATTSTAAIFPNSSIASSEIRHLATASISFLGAGSGDTIAALVGTTFINGDPNAIDGPTVLVNSNAEAIFTGTQYLAALDVLPGGTARMAEDGTSVLVTDALNLAAPANGFAGGILDLADNDLIVHGGSLDAVQSLLANGYNGGAWNDLSDFGSGPAPAAIDSSAAAENYNYDGIESLGDAEVGQPSSPTAGLFDGQSVSDGDVVVRFTYYGDANLDGAVNSVDETALANGEANNLTGWNNGDFDYSGVIDDNDAALLDASESFDLAAPLPPAAENQLYSFTLPGDAIEANTEISTIQNWQVRWGDGLFDNYTVPAGDSPEVLASHTYATPNVGGYAVSIIASGTGGYGSRSHIYTLVLPHEDVVVAPDAPTNLSARESKAGEVDLTWTDDTELAAGYVVTATPTTGGTTITQNTNSSTFAAALTGLTPDVSYTFGVAADNTLSDGISAQSAAATTTAIAPAAALTATGPTNVNEGTTGSALNLSSGSSSNITSWQVIWTDESGNVLSTDTVTGSSGTDAYPSPMPLELSATITAHDSAGNSFVLPSFTSVLVPNAPTGLTDSVASSTEIDLSWVDRSSVAVEDFIYESTDDGATFQQIDDIAPNAAGVSNTDAITGLTPGDSYQFYVTAGDGYTESAPSGTVTATTTYVAAPLAPSGLTITNTTMSEVDLSWTNNSTPMTGDEILVSTDGENYYAFDATESPATTYQATGLNSGTTYYFTVAAVNGTVVSASSSPVSTTTSGIPEPLDLVVISTFTHEVVLSWDDPSGLATSFQIERSSDGGANFETINSNVAAVPGGLTTYGDVTAQDGMDYEYEVVGSESGVLSNPSASVDATTNVLAPTDFTAVAASDGSSVTLTWSNPSSASPQFEIDRQSPGTGGWTTLTTTDEGDTSDTYLDTNVLGQTTYTYRIQAISQLANSAYATCTVTTPLAAPAMPASLAASDVSATSIEVTWAAGPPPGGAATGYIVNVSGNEGQSFWQFGDNLPATTTSVLVTGLSASTIYLFEVTAVNAAGSSDPAGPVGATTSALPLDTPTLTTSDGPTSWNSVTLNFASTNIPQLEFEQEDETAGENFHDIPVTAQYNSNGSTYGIVYGLTLGDTYAFRVRADHSDGTVSNWSGGTYTPYTTLPAPDLVLLSETDSNGVEHVIANWSNAPDGGNVSFELTSDAYPKQEVLVSGLNSGSLYPSDAEGGGSVVDPGIRGDSGHYTYQVQGFTTDGEPTNWSSPQTVTLPEAQAPQVSYSMVTDTSFILNWVEAAAANTETTYDTEITQVVPGQLDKTIASYQAFDGIGGEVAGGESGTSEQFSTTLTPLTPETTYHIVMISHNFVDGDTFTYLGFTQFDVTTTGYYPPGTPAALNAVYNVPAGGVALNWNDNSNFETSFVIQRSVDDINYTQVGNTGTDVSSFIDPTAKQDSVYYYRVLAVNGSADSGYSNTVRVDTTGVKIAIGGSLDPAGNPDIILDPEPASGPVSNVVPDPNLVELIAQVPLGEDDFGTATLSWPSSILLWTNDLRQSQVGTAGPGGQTSFTWNVSNSSSQTFYVQGTGASTYFGDQVFGLAAQLFLTPPFSGDPPPLSTTPSTNKPTTVEGITISVAGVGDVTNGNAKPIILPGTHEVITGTYHGPRPGAGAYQWQWDNGSLPFAAIPPEVLKQYITGKNGVAVPLDAKAMMQQTLDFYWINVQGTATLKCTVVIGGSSFSATASHEWWLPDRKLTVSQVPTPHAFGTFMQADFGLISTVHADLILATGSVSIPDPLLAEVPRGNACFMQIIDSSVTETYNGNTLTNGGTDLNNSPYSSKNFYGVTGLDNSFPYSGSVATGQNGTFKDAPTPPGPHVGIIASGAPGGTRIVYSSTFSTYLMFQPQGGCWVAVDKFSWTETFDVTEQNNNNNYSFVPTTGSPPPSVKVTAGPNPVIETPTWDITVPSPYNWYKH